MAQVKQRVQEQIALLEAEILRIETQAAKSKAILRAQISVLRRAEAALSPEMEALLGELTSLGIKFEQ